MPRYCRPKIKSVLAGIRRANRLQAGGVDLPLSQRSSSELHGCARIPARNSGQIGNSRRQRLQYGTICLTTSLCHHHRLQDLWTDLCRNCQKVELLTLMSTEHYNIVRVCYIPLSPLYLHHVSLITLITKMKL